jgi:type I restriction enzyme S subunit
MEAVAEKYKQTEIGLIPSDWEVKELGSILTFGSGRDYKQLQNGEIPVYGTGGIMTYVDDFLYDGESVGIGRKGTIDKPVLLNGKFWTVDTLFYTHQFQNSNPKFIYYKFCLIKWKEFNEASGVPSLNKNTLEKIKVSVPQLAEQTLIATALSDADALISSLEKLIAKKRNIKQGAMQKLLQPKEGWEVKKLGEIATFFKGKGLPKSHLKENGRFKCIHYGELFTKYKESIKSILSYTDENENCFYSSSNDVLMPTSDVTPNGLATASCIKEDGVILGGDVLVIRLPKDVLDGLFLSYNISQNKEKVMSMVTGSTVYHLYGSDMKRFEIYYPPIEQQIETIKILSDMDAEISALETKLEKYKKVKLGMMQNLLTGKIRLV